jgi:hypothetical protein
MRTARRYQEVRKCERRKKTFSVDFCVFIGEEANFVAVIKRRLEPRGNLNTKPKVNQLPCLLN